MFFRWDARLIRKEYLTDKVIYFEFTCIPNFSFQPGQFVTIKVPNRNIPRAYSIVSVNSTYISFLIDISPQGINSKYFESMNINDTVEIAGPYGLFMLKNNNKPKIFLCTSTGIAPFLPMFYKIFEEKKSSYDVTLCFGTRFNRHDFVYAFIKQYFNYSSFKYYRCVSREDRNTFDPKNLNVNFFAGRITNLLPILKNKNIEQFLHSEFYICGSNEIVESIKNTLLDLSVLKENIFFEKYN
ncbi:MAG: FAD-dependent oxidoreductase [Candidatus Dojkabacteria bacterium]|nr:FAD-dependent oxidoreductase [Candidatus Dojkabacteria bacterium]